MVLMAAASVVSILAQVGIYHPPNWLVWAILAAGTASVVITILVTAGYATIPASVAWALVGANSFSL